MNNEGLIKESVELSEKDNVLLKELNSLDEERIHLDKSVKRQRKVSIILLFISAFFLGFSLGTLVMKIIMLYNGG